MTGKALLVGLLLAVVGCQARHSAREIENNQQRPETAVDYAAALQKTIYSYLPNQKKYQGKTCSLRLQQKNGEKPTAVTIAEGDKVFCRAMKKTLDRMLEKDAFPYLPAEWQVTEQGIPIDFHP
ncbi:cell envelope integrity TolA C-terminal domain-containing protein [Entomohabitans teleogrylli]|uniref:cell envelope integrity TolA C-terminal domain-containing protein n=1 Tax=Entomohabitans teleogrylli TaxID=1384589 RepID=UPI0013794116|nr:cell envelope integrity TolA C-terminal domain-containing protein [Entomohabitans teleogrylli]